MGLKKQNRQISLPPFLGGEERETMNNEHAWCHKWQYREKQGGEKGSVGNGVASLIRAVGGVVIDSWHLSKYMKKVREGAMEKFLGEVF